MRRLPRIPVRYASSLILVGIGVLGLLSTHFLDRLSHGLAGSSAQPLAVDPQAIISWSTERLVARGGQWIDEYNEVVFEFPFRNTGDGPLNIDYLNASCACSRIVAEPERINPGEAGVIRATMRVAGEEQAAAADVLVYSNAPASPAKLSFAYVP